MNTSSKLLSLINETRSLFHRLKSAGDELHSAAGINSSLRGVMESLSKDGPQSVPQIARNKSVSRQHIQLIVNQLLTQGLIEPQINPAHRRSDLFALTVPGRELFATVEAHELTLLANAEHGLSDSDLSHAVATLQKLNVYFQSEDWATLLKTRGIQACP